jgi:predicted RNase H-like HicB family nuclease
MPGYEIIIYWSQADHAFIAEVPELPGCAADGKTYKEALANVEIIIQEWIETAKELGRPIPAPCGHPPAQVCYHLPVLFSRNGGIHAHARNRNSRSCIFSFLLSPRSGTG